jgi:5-hydroxyisourate hydrolase
MSGISTHILDTAKGAPVSGLPVRLERQEASGQWTILSSAHSNSEGRCSQLLPEDQDLIPGTYRLTFDTASYFSAQVVRWLYPIVQITFTAREAETHYHVPLLLSPYGYTTYRGS